VRIVQGIGDRRHDLQGLLGRKEGGFLAIAAEQGALEVLHRDIGETLLLAGVIDRDDIGV
jgi:hypothetical protein